MSMAVLLQTARDVLRTAFPAKECDVQDTGQPPPGVGQRFISIHPLTWAPYEGLTTAYRSVQESYTFGVTVSLRIRNLPADRRDTIYLNQFSGIENLCRLTIQSLTMDPAIVDLLNANLTAQEVILDDADDLPGGFEQQPFMSIPAWIGGDAAPTPRMGDWFWHTGENVAKEAGWSMQVNFGNVYRGLNMDSYAAGFPTLPSP